MATGPDLPPAPPTGPAALFDRVADTYDAVGVEWFGPIARGLVAELRPATGERALDVGCGRGAVLFPLARAVGPTGHVLGIDLAPRMVAATAADAAALPHVEVRVGDATAPDAPPGAFDLLASSLVLFFLPDPGAALKAWRPLLRPGGRVGVTTFDAQDPGWQAVDELFMPYLPAGLRDARTSGRSGPFGSDEGVAALLTVAGFTAVRTAHADIDTALDDAGQWHAFSWSHGQRAMWEAVPEPERAGLRERAGALLETLRGDDGRVHLRQRVRYTLGLAPDRP